MYSLFGYRLGFTEVCLEPADKLELIDNTSQGCSALQGLRAKQGRRRAAILHCGRHVDEHVWGGRVYGSCRRG